MHRLHISGAKLASRGENYLPTACTYRLILLYSPQTLPFASYTPLSQNQSHKGSKKDDLSGKKPQKQPNLLSPLSHKTLWFPILPPPEIYYFNLYLSVTLWKFLILSALNFIPSRFCSWETVVFRSRDLWFFRIYFWWPWQAGTEQC